MEGRMLHVVKGQEKSVRVMGRDGRPAKVISVTSGKGGVGKSSVTSNLALGLAAKGARVLLIDGDFGLANLDIMFDLRSHRTVDEVLRGEVTIREVVVTVADGVDVLPASSGLHGMTSLRMEDKVRYLDAITELELDYDYFLIDTGAGISDEVTWLNSRADEIVLVATPEPTSLADAYALIKVMSQKHKIKRYRLLVNQVKSEAEALRVFQHLTGVTDRFLNVTVDFFGFVLWDDLWTHSIRQRKPILSAFPGSQSAKRFLELADTIKRSGFSRRTEGPPHFFKTLMGHA
jgi:flagellar biosynthesis protein FlhG